MYKKRFEIAGFIEEKNLDVSAITESWLKGTDKDKAIINVLIPPGFKLHHVPRSKKRGGGVVVVNRSSTECKKVKVSVKTSRFELMEVMVKISNQTIEYDISATKYLIQ